MDYDIDKLYILAHSVNGNGLVQTGSSLQSKYGLDFVTSLTRPNGMTYQVVESPEGAFTISADTLLRFNEDTLSNEEIAALYNQIYKESNGNIYFEPTPTLNIRTRNRVINKMLNEINGHAGSVLERNSDPNYLKNRIVSAIYDLTTKLQNQMIAQIPVDMGDPQEAAKNSTLGRAEMHINSDNPATKFMMQVQNMIGKEVIGISAVSLKAFFGLYYYYSTLNQNLKDACTYSNPETDADTIIDALDKLLIIHPLTGEITSLANIDIEQVQEVIANDNRFRHLRVNPVIQHKFNGSKWYKNGELNLIGFLKDLQASVNKIDAALTDSAVISAATDFL